MKMVRLSADERRSIITRAIEKLADEIGTYNLTHDNVAEACTVETSRHTVKHYFRTKQRLYDVASDYLYAKETA